MENSEMNDDDIIRKRAARIRTHGLKYPLHPYQVGSWIFYFINVVSYYFIVLVSIKHHTGLVITISAIFTILIIVVAILVTIATLIDPTDDIVKRGKKEPSESFAFYCKICQSNVSDNSKHCGQCNRCVANFDHHCKWLNNCVGDVNYKLFIYLCISVLSFQVYYCIILFYSVLEFFINREEYEASLSDLYGNETGTPFVAISIIIFVLNILPIVAILNLLSLHIWLKKKGLSTYDYIIQKREKLQEEYNRKIKELQLRISNEEQKESKDDIHSGRSDFPVGMAKKDSIGDHKNKSTILQFNDDASKGSLMVNKHKRNEIDIKADNEYLGSNENNKSLSPEVEQEMGFRKTDSSMWKQKDGTPHTSDICLNGTSDNQETKDECYQSSKNLHQDISNFAHRRQVNKAKISDLHIIDDVSESKELSQRAFESFSKSKNASSYTHLQKAKGENIRNFNSSMKKPSLGRNEHNSSGIIKSCSENISQIMNATFKEEDEKNTEENAYGTEKRDDQAYYFSTTRPRSSKPYVEGNSELSNPKIRVSNKSVSKRMASKKSSVEPYDKCAEEIKDEDPKPYNFISQQIKNEALSKHKNLEKGNQNWLVDSESGNTLSYSKVFGTSSREYVQIGDVNKLQTKKLDPSQEMRKNENYDKIINYDNQTEKKFTSYNSPENNFNEEDQVSNDTDHFNDEELGEHGRFDSREVSEASHNATKKNLFLQENIIDPEDPGASLEEVKEYDEESESKNCSGRKDSHNALRCQ
ncbi:unnamed protein product [Moneuplotes crassus]|uniref:Palmitoyltransferase n=1 Tax=Euplotes crassus TaxID=5936 RepID=A0AAD1Y7V3_EUPCR|nr:unnamed protein product [Moneuplotes crassus]